MGNQQAAFHVETLAHEGREQTVAQRAGEIGIKPSTLMKRLEQVRRGLLTIERAMNPERVRITRTTIRARKLPIRQEMVDAIPLPFWADDWTWYITKVHPDGLTLEQISELHGLTRERVRQVEEAAMRKVKKLERLRGTAVDIVGLLREMDALRAGGINSLGSGGDEVAA